MDRFEALRKKAKLCLDEIFVTPLVKDQGTQTEEIADDDLKSILRKRKAEFWDIFDEILNGENTIFSRHVTVVPGKGFKRPESGASSVSDVSDDNEPVVSEEDSVSPCAKSPEFSTAASSKVETSVRLKLMRELAEKRNLQVYDAASLDTLFHGQTNEQLIEQIDTCTPPAPAFCYTMHFEQLMDFGKIEQGAYATLNKETKQKYVAGIMDELFKLMKQHDSKPASLRAIASAYNVSYDHIYDVWRGRSSNPYLTVERPAHLHNLR